ncbi:sensor histidine kinase [Halorhabdus amylolytica]|uniref:sensor histidine kinase n=1 Tax=Halorhabdus amylolytica TaxID=2559573 RepID=UPI0010A9B344|nr:HAMP domain-containing sensor histidine kinase [Halorhabdus amylolytica]
MDQYVSRANSARPEGGILSSLIDPLSRWELTPGRIAAVYLLFGFVGLYVSDVVFARTFSEPLQSQVQAAKGGLEVLVTAGFIFAISVASRRQHRRTNERLQRRNEELHVLHRVLRHNLRNDLNVIEGHAEYVEATLENDDLADTCGTITRKAEAIVSYIERAGQIRRLSESQSVETFDLARIVPMIADRHDELTDAVDLTVDVPDVVPVAANHMLSAALEELLTNAMVHANSDTPTVSIRVSTIDAPRGMTLIEIADDGPGIPEDVRRIIESDERDQLAHLSGLGLWFVHWTVTDVGGSLSFDVDADGTTVRILVPTADAD